MKNIALCFAAICLHFLSNGQTWVLKKDSTLCEMGNNPFASVINGKAYIGYKTQLICTCQDWLSEYDPATNTYTAKTPPICNECMHISFTLNNKMYVINSTNGDTNNMKMSAYDPATDSWTVKHAMPPLPALPGSQIYNINDCFFFSVNNKGYIGGFTATGTSGNFLPYFLEYDPVTDMYTQKANLPDSFANSGATGYGFNGKGYVFGGIKEWATTGPVAARHAFSYDPVSNHWTEIAKPLHGGTYAGGYLGGAFDCNGQIFYGFSTADYKGPDKKIEAYNPTTNTWSLKTSVPTPDTMANGVGFTINNKGYLGLGTRFDMILNGQPTSPKLYQYTETGAGVAEINKDKLSFNISPNPARGKAVVVISEFKTGGDYNIELSDVNGRKLISGKLNMNETELDISALSSGVYMCRISANGAQATQKLIVY